MLDLFEYATDNDKIVTLAIHRTDTPMNVMDGPLLEQLEANYDKAVAAGAIGVILTSARKEFMAGADLGMLQKIQSAADSMVVTGAIHRLTRKLETGPIPIVAALNGTCLGGGYELALACHWRVALDTPKSQIGLPEVTLGLLPGGGGTQRLPRLIGFEKALPLLIEGKKLDPQRAKAAGLVEELAATPQEMLSKAKTWILEHPGARQPWDDKKFRLPGGEVQSPKGYQVFTAGSAMVKQKTYGNYPAPVAILSCVYEGLQVPFEQGLAIESRYFAKLFTGPEARNMIRTLFFGINACNKGVARPKGTERKAVQKVAVLGAGMMGSGIAYVAARAGIPVILKDVSLDYALKGKSYSEGLLAKMVKQGRLSADDMQQVLDLIRATDDPNAVEGCDLVIETVTEDRAIKARVTQESERVVPESAVVASNTSTIPITTLAKSSSRPQNFVGLHFFSPVDKMPLVEIIRGEQTSDAAVSLCLDFTAQIKKTPIVVNDRWGFYTSRVFMTYVEEGVFCLQDGVSPALVENAGRMAGMPVGPLAVADEVSLDLVAHILEQAKIDLGPDAIDAKLDKAVQLFANQLQRLGRKSGHGFYEYPPEGKKYLWPGLQEHFPVSTTQPEAEWVKQRLVYRQVLETVKCLEENVLTTPWDADVGAILGWGFPAFTGGPLSYVDSLGVKTFNARCRDLQAVYGDRFALPAMLVKMEAEGSRFYQD